MDPAEIQDMVATTLDVFWPKAKGTSNPGYVQIAQKFQRFAFYGLLMQQDRLTFEGGIGVTTTLMDKASTNASWVGLFEEATAKQTDIFTQMKIDFKWVRNNWTYDVKQPQMNSGSKQIANFIKGKDQSCTLGLIEKVETSAWANPVASATKEMFPIPFWVVFDSTQDGHVGKYPDGFTSLAGVNLDNHPNFQNYSHRWTDPTAEDLLSAWRSAHLLTGFQSPLDKTLYDETTGLDFRIFTNHEGMLTAWEMKDDRNPETGFDIADTDRGTSFKQNKFVYTSALDANQMTLKAANGTTTMTIPYYFLNRSSFKAISLGRDFMRRTPPMNDIRDPDTYVNFKILAIQTLCDDRRAQAIVSKVA